MEEVIVLESLTFRATSCLWDFCCTRWLRCTPASSSDLLASRFSGPMPDQCLPHKSAAQWTLFVFVHQYPKLATSSAPRPFIIASLSRKSLHCFLRFWLLAVPKRASTVASPSSLAHYREVVPNGSGVAQLQHLSQSTNIQRHISSPHPRQFQRAFVKPSQATGSKSS